MIHESPALSCLQYSGELCNMRNPRYGRAARAILLSAIACAAPVVAAAQSTPPQSSLPEPTLTHRPPAPGPRIHGAIAEPGRMRLDAVVTDSAGKPVLGLEPWDFSVSDDNQPRKILSFHGFDGVKVKPDPPVEIVLVLDVANLPFQQVSFVRDQIAKFLRQDDGRLAQPVSLILVGDAGMRVQPRPSVDGNALVSVLDQVKGIVGTINPAMGAEGSLARFQLSIRHLSTIAEYEAKKPGRKLLVWISPGWPILNGSNFVFSDKDQRRYFDAIVQLSTRLREGRIALYSVSPASSTSDAGMHTNLYQMFLKPVKSPRQADTGNLALKVLTTQTGGRNLGPDNDVTGQINSCIADANAFYSLSFDPPHAEHADEFHDLHVAVNKPGLTVRTYSGYYDQP